MPTPTTSPTPSFVRIPTGYQGYDPSTVFTQDANTKTLRPITSGDAFTGAGFNFGQVKPVLASDLSGYNVGANITQASDFANPAQTLSSLKDSLNSYQNGLFTEGDTNSPQRQSSQLTDEINSTLADEKSQQDEFQKLREAFNSQDTPSLTDYFNTLRTQAGVPQTESDLLAVKDAERNLEGGLRTVSGDASPTTEALFQADLAQRQKPLTLKETALNDRLALASDYITKALNLKQTDNQTASDHLSKAIQLVQDSISASNTRISTLNTLKSAIDTQTNQGQSRAQATLNTLIQAGALDKLPDNDLSLLEHQAGMPVGSLAAIRDSIKPKSNVIGTETDDNGNIAVLTQNTDGSFAAHVIPGVKGKTSSDSAANTGITQTAQATVQALAGQNPSTWTEDQWTQRRAQFVQDFGEKAAQNLYDQTIPKPAASANLPSKIGNAWNGIVNFFKKL